MQIIIEEHLYPADSVREYGTGYRYLYHSASTPYFIRKEHADHCRLTRKELPSHDLSDADVPMTKEIIKQ